jgi:hypothetical protein
MGQQFTGIIEAGRGGGALVVIPDKVVTALGGSSRFRVTGTLAGVTFESFTMAMGGGRICMGVHKATRQAAGVEIGDRVKIELDRDDRPRQLTVPDDLAAALARDASAGAAFEKLSFTHRREYVEWITGAKRQETRARRLAQTVDRLHG